MLNSHHFGLPDTEGWLIGRKHSLAKGAPCLPPYIITGVLQEWRSRWVKPFRSVRQLFNESMNCNSAYATFIKGEKYEALFCSFDQITVELTEAVRHLHLLDRHISELNLKQRWSGMVKRYVLLMQSLSPSLCGKRQKNWNALLLPSEEEIESKGLFDRGDTVIRRALFNPDHVRETALKMGRNVNFLSSLIDSANYPWFYSKRIAAYLERYPADTPNGTPFFPQIAAPLDRAHKSLWPLN